MQAFLGDIDLKTRTANRLDRDLREGRVERVRTRWDGRNGSLAASLVRDADLSLGESRLGLPEPLLRLIDHFCADVYFADDFLPSYARSLVAAIVPGADLVGIPAQFTQWLLDSSDHVMHKPPATEPVLHASDVQPAQVLTRWLDAGAQATVTETGWTATDEANAQAELNRLWEATAAERLSGDWPDYPALFAQSAPALAAGYVASLETANEAVSRYANMAFMHLVTLIAAASTAKEPVGEAP